MPLVKSILQLLSRLSERIRLKTSWQQLASLMYHTIPPSSMHRTSQNVTRTSIVGLAPIHFLPHSHLLPVPGGLHVHTHAIPILADHTLSLPLLVILPLIMSSFHLYYICSLDPRLIPPMPLPLYQYPSYYTLNPLPYYWSITLSPLALTVPLDGDSVPGIITIVSVCDSVPPLPLPYYWSLTQFPFCLPISVLLLIAWSVLSFPTYINLVYQSCIP
jgi:hypothetical protein